MIHSLKIRRERKTDLVLFNSTALGEDGTPTLIMRDDLLTFPAFRLKLFDLVVANFKQGLRMYTLFVYTSMPRKLLIYN